MSQARSRSSRRTFLRLALALGFSAAAKAFAQAGPRTLRIGVLSTGDAANRGALEESLVRGLREKGWVEGRNLVIERRYSSERVVENAKDLAAMKLDAVVTSCSPSTRVMRDASASTPIVMASVSDPVSQGLVASLARPGGNVTGTSSQAENLLVKRLELMAELLPGGASVAVVLSGRNPVHEPGWQRLEKAAPAFRFKLQKVVLAHIGDFGTTIDSAMRAKPTALFVMPDDPMMFNLRHRLLETAARHRLPDFHWDGEFVEAGGLTSYGESLRDSYHRTAAYMDGIAKGMSPAQMAVTLPTRFELAVNLKRARALGITVPASYLAKADRVVE